MTDAQADGARSDGRTTVDFDHHSAKIAPDPYPAYEELRAGCPVAWSEHHGGFWVITDYAGVFAAATDDDTFRSAPGNVIPLLPYGIRNVPIDTDSPEAEQFRSVLLKDYSPRQTENLTPHIAEVADRLIDEFIERGNCDFVRELAMPLPATIILELLGLPAAQWEFFVSRIHRILHDNDMEVAKQCGLELAGAVAEEVAERRRDGYRDDQLSKIMQATINGEPITDQDITSYALMLFFGGLDTSTAAIANALVVLDEDRALRNRLIDRPQDLPRAVEELLRFHTPVGALGRTLSRDTVMGGQCLKAGDRALLVWASANRDSAAFDQPDKVDIDRTPNRHIAFGVGAHRCLGSNLGRVMFRVMLERVLERIPDYSVVGDPSRYRYEDASSVYALRRLPATFSPGLRTRV